MFTRILQLAFVPRPRPGPCGPCSEVFWDQNVSLPTGSLRDVDADNQWLEIWNLVFMQHWQDGQSTTDGLAELERKSVDTGMGLERIVRYLHNPPHHAAVALVFPSVAQLACNPLILMSYLSIVGVGDARRRNQFSDGRFRRALGNRLELYKSTWTPHG